MSEENELLANEILSKLTDEQRRVVESEADITLVEALAGSGKTHTLIEYCKYRILKNPSSKILYLVFNNDMARGTERKIGKLKPEFARRIKAQTINSLAHQTLIATLSRFEKGNIDSDKVSSYFSECMADKNVGKTLWIKDILSELGFEEDHTFCYIVSRLFTAFNQSAYTIDQWKEKVYYVAEKFEEFQAREDTYIQENIYRACEASIQFVEKVYSSIFPAIVAYSNGEEARHYLNHNIVLKLFQLSIERCNGSDKDRYTHLLVDESQDLNEVMISIVTSRFFEGAKKVFVGDNQQKIYAFTGCVSALSKLEKKKEDEGLPDNVISKLYLTTSFRCIPLITEEANVYLDFLGFGPRMTSMAKMPSNMGEHNFTKARIFRTNSSILMFMITNPDAKFIVRKFPTKELYEIFRDLIFYFYGNDEQREKIKNPTLRLYPDKKELEEYLERTNDIELSSKIKLLERYTRLKNVNIMRYLKERIKHQIVVPKKGEEHLYWELITAHKSKGLEWDYVEIADDFPTIFTTMGSKARGDFKYVVSEKEYSREEGNLFYVAITRAKYFIDFSEEYAIRPQLEELKRKVRIID